MRTLSQIGWETSSDLDQLGLKQVLLARTRAKMFIQMERPFEMFGRYSQGAGDLRFVRGVDAG